MNCERPFPYVLPFRPTESPHVSLLGPALLGFLRVAELGSVSRAARTLHLSQPAVSKQVRALEQALGTALLERSGRGVRLTPAGVLLADYGRRSAALLDEGREALSELDAEDGGRLRLGAGATTCIFQLPAWLRRLRAERPRVDITVRTGASRAVASWVLERELELGLVTSSVAHAELELRVLFREPIVLVSAPERARPAALEQLPLILFPATTGFREYLDRQLGAERLRSLVKMETDSVEVIKSFVAGDLGASFLPQSAVAAELARGTLRRVSLRGLPRLRRSTALIRRRDRKPGRVAARFVQILAASKAGPAERRARMTRRRR